MFKWAGACMVFVAAAGIGFRRAVQIRRQYEELKYLRKILVMLRGQISYSVAGISEVFWDVSGHLREPYHEIFCKLSQELENNAGKKFREIWDEQVINPLGQLITCEKDLDKLRELGEHLGYLDKEMQENYLNICIENMEQSIAERGESVRNEEKFSKVMGILGGLFIILFLW